MAKDEVRMADTYEIETAFYLNGKEIVFGVDKKAELSYMVGLCSINPIALLAQHQSEDFPGMEICGTYFAEKKDAGTAIIEACKAQTSQAARDIGKYKGFTLLLSFDSLSQQFKLTLRGSLSHTIDLGNDIHGNIQRMDNALEAFPTKMSVCEKQLESLVEQRENAKAEIEKPFMQEEELKTKSARLAELDALLNIDKKENDTLDAEPEQQEEKVMERSEPER